MQQTAALTHQGRSIAFYSMAVALTVATGLVASVFPLSALPLTLGVALTAAFIRADNDAAMIPTALRPAPIAFGSLTIAAISAGHLSDSEFEGYFVMWLLQAGGMIAGFFIAPKLGAWRARSSRPVNLAYLHRFAYVVFLGFLGAAVLYFATEGIPALKSDLEQARVDAATGGTGFIRVFAFLAPTAAAALVALRAPKAWIAVVISLAFMWGVGNRVPFVYFLFPLVVMFAVTTRRLRSGKIVAIALLLVVLMGALAAYRISSTEDIQKEPQYRAAVASGDNVKIGRVALEHYAEVVPENAVLVKRLVDERKIPYQWGATYFTLFASALPGQQVSPDMMIKDLNGKDFLGGGIPPTLAGEGYMNFGYPGVFLNGMLAMLLLRYWGSTVVASSRTSVDIRQRQIVGVVYGYAVTWTVLAQISGFAGSATVSLAGFLLLVGLRWLGARVAAE